MESDRDYFERRAAEQRKAAAEAQSEEVRRVHLKLARMLGELIDRGEARRSRS